MQQQAAFGELAPRSGQRAGRDRRIQAGEPLLLAERFERVDLRGAARRDVTGEQSHTGKQ